MNILDQIGIFLLSLLTSISVFFTSISVPPAKAPDTISPIPTVFITTLTTPTVTQIINNLTSRPTAKLTPTPTQSPTQEMISACREPSARKEYFSGLNCFAEEYDKYILENKVESSSGSIGEREAEFKLLSSKNSVVEELLTQNCLRIGVAIYHKCNDSLAANLDRIKNQILEKTASDRQVCLVKIGDNNKKEKTTNNYWRLRLREKMNDLYTQCAMNNGSLDAYNY